MNPAASSSQSVRSWLRGIRDLFGDHISDQRDTARRPLCRLGLERLEDRLAPSVTAPKFELLSPKSGLTVSKNITIKGEVLNATKVASVYAEVDGGHAAKVALASGAKFSFATHMSLNGDADGKHTVLFMAKAKTGSQLAKSTYTFTLHAGSPKGTKTFAKYTVGGFELTNVHFKSGTKGESIDGDAKLPLVGKVHFTGTYVDSNHFDLVVTHGPFTALNGLVKFTSVKLDLTPKTLTLTGSATAGQIAKASFKGVIDSHGNYALHAKATVTVAGFTLDGAELNLGSKELAVAASVPVPSIGNVGFEGSYGPGNHWSLGATIPGPVVVGTFPLTDLHFVLSDHSLTLGARTGIDGVLDGGVTGTINKDGTFLLTVDAKALHAVGGFSVANAVVTLGNNYPHRLFRMDIHAIAGVPFGPNIKLDGFVDAKGNYDLKGTGTYGIAGLNFAQGSFELKKGQGLAFQATLDYGVFTADGKGTIDKYGHAQFHGSIQGQLGGFNLANVTADVDINPSQHHYSVDLHGTLYVYVATVNFSAHAGRTGSTWDPLTLTGTATAHVGSFLSGSATFTVSSGGVGFSGRLTVANIGTTFSVNATVHSDGSVDIGGVHLGLANLSLSDAAKILSGLGANLVQIAGGLWHTATSDLGALCATLSKLDTNLGNNVKALSSVVNNVGQVASALWHNFKGGTFHLNDLAVALWNHWNGSTFHLADLTGALSKLDSNLGDNVKALSSVVDDVTKVADALWHNFQGGTFHLTDLATGLWNHWNGSTFHLANLTVALSKLDTNLGDNVKALSGVINDVGKIADALWHNFQGATFHLTDLASALWNHWGGSSGFDVNALCSALSAVDGSLSDTVAALSTVVDDVDQVASALWNHFKGASFYLTDLSTALWHHWSGSSFTTADLAGALSAIDNSLGDVVSALSQVTSSAAEVAGDVWNHWKNDVNWNAADLISELEGVFRLGYLDALAIVNSL